jgi:ribosomal protein S18 acetylase RimI-like enzyme
VTETLPRTTEGDTAGSYFEVQEIRRVSDIENAFAQDRAFGAYALGHLEYELFPLARFWQARGDAGSAVVMHARALGPTMVVAGDASALAALLALHPGARYSYLSTAAPEHMRTLERYYHVTTALQMQRMEVDAAHFHAKPGPVRRLRGTDVNRINSLYATDGGPSNYTHDTIERAIYYGIFDADELVSVAGTHIVAPNQGISVVGNVFTHRRARGRGFASAVTSAVTHELLERGCQQVVLTVDPKNTPAVTAYDRLGYRPGTAVVEARLKRRDFLGLAPAVRRWAARRRSHTPGVELIDPDR